MKVEVIHKDIKGLLWHEKSRLAGIILSALFQWLVIFLAGRDRNQYVDGVQQLANTILFWTPVAFAAYNSYKFAEYASKHYRPKEE